jgi:hypothetical protein
VPGRLLLPHSNVPLSGEGGLPEHTAADGGSTKPGTAAVVRARVHESIPVHSLLWVGCYRQYNHRHHKVFLALTNQAAYAFNTAPSPICIANGCWGASVACPACGNAGAAREVVVTTGKCAMAGVGRAARANCSIKGHILLGPSMPPQKCMVWVLSWLRSPDPGTVIMHGHIRPGDLDCQGEMHQVSVSLHSARNAT